MFFSFDVIRFDKTGLPVFKDMTIEEAFGQFDEDNVQERFRAFQEEFRLLKETQSRARIALHSQLALMEGFSQLDLGQEGAMEKWSSS